MHTIVTRNSGWFKLMAGALFAVALMPAGSARAHSGYMPNETATHEGTWLQWPHAHTYGRLYRNRIEPTWVAMTKALVTSENVHIIVYGTTAETRVRNELTAAGISLTRVNFLIRQTDDVWVRDNGPIFVYDGASDRLKVDDWGFDGWGLDAPYRKDNQVPVAVARRLGMPRVNLNRIELEGGAVAVDGRGVFMATRSSILDRNRNPHLSEAQLDAVLADQLGVEKFIWLDGKPGGKEDITDMHIDGFAQFGTRNTIVTMNRRDLRYWGLSSQDIDRLYGATDIDNVPYHFVFLPLTAHDVVTSYGYDLGYKGSYVNYYVGNTVVLVPQYNDPNDAVAKFILQQLYRDRTVIGIDVRNLYREGGMVHCVTQPQPAALQ